MVKSNLGHNNLVPFPQVLTNKFKEIWKLELSDGTEN